MTDKQRDTVERRRITGPETIPQQIEIARASCGARSLDDGNPGALVIYTGRFKQTKTVAVGLADLLSRRGLTAELADGDTGAIPSPADYAAVVIGSCVRFGRHPHSVIDYVVRSRDALAAMPAFFFSIGSDEDIGQMSRATGWRPTNSAVFDLAAPDRRRF